MVGVGALAGLLAVAAGLTLAGCLAPRKERAPDEQPSGGRAPAPSSDPPRQDPPAEDAGVHRVDPRFAPIEAIVERVPLPGLSRTTATTVGTKVYVADLKGWLRRHPPGSALYDAVLLHEQVHARRQLAAGVDPWIERYLRDRAFMWDEEQRGWYVQLQHLRQQGLAIDAQAVARNLSKYRNLAGAMVSYDDALTWTQAVLAGTWTPPP